MFIDIISQAIWPPARRRAKAAEEERQRAAAAAAEAARLEAEAERKQREAEEQVQSRYQSHLKAVDLTGQGTKYGSAISVTDLEAAVEKRILVSTEAQGDREMKLVTNATDEELQAVTGNLDPEALYMLLEHDDPVRQHGAARALLDARSKVRPSPTLHAYATAVGEAAARAKGYRYAHHRIIPAIVARAILLRSASGKWDRNRSGGLRPLSKAR